MKWIGRTWMYCLQIASSSTNQVPFIPPTILIMLIHFFWPIRYSLSKSTYFDAKSTDLHFTVILQATFPILWKSWKLDTSTASTRNHTTYIPFPWKTYTLIISFYSSQFPSFCTKQTPNKSDFGTSFPTLYPTFSSIFCAGKTIGKIHPNSIPSGPGVLSIRALLSASLRCGVCVVLSCVRGEGEATRGLGLGEEPVTPG